MNPNYLKRIMGSNVAKRIDELEAENRHLRTANRELAEALGKAYLLYALGVGAMSPEESNRTRCICDGTELMQQFKDVIAKSEVPHA